MEETHYRAKRMRPLGKRRVAALAAVLVLLLGIAAAGVRYFDFVSRTVYEESTAHLAEVLHQSNNMLNEVVEKNLTYLHMWETTMRHISDEDEIRQFIESVQQETGFSDFYFLSTDGNYMTAAGETGYLGIQDDLEEQIISDLYSYRDKATGKRVVGIAMRNKDSVVLGLGGAECGDIIFTINEGFNRLHGDGLSTAEGYAQTSVTPVFLAAGEDIKEGKITDRVIRQVDVAPTIAEILDVRKPEQCEGAPVYQILKK